MPFPSVNLEQWSIAAFWLEAVATLQGKGGASQDSLVKPQRRGRRPWRAAWPCGQPSSESGRDPEWSRPLSSD